MRAYQIGFLVLLIGQVGACALLPESGRARHPEDLDTFVRLLGEDIEAQEWQSLLAVVDPAVFRERVVEEGTPEPELLAELLGLARPGNRLQEGDEVVWEDLARITSVNVMPIGDGEPPHRIGGQVVLTTGAVLQVDAEVTRVQGRFVLTDEPRPLAGGR